MLDARRSLFAGVAFLVALGLATCWAVAAKPSAVRRGSNVQAGNETHVPSPLSPLSRIQPPAKYQIVYSFSGPDGAYLTAALIVINGSIYGATEEGGLFANGIAPRGGGTVFKIDPSGRETILHSFGNSSDGAYPSSALINVNGVLYGSTQLGGTHEMCAESSDSEEACYGGGIVYALDATGAERVVYNFNSRPGDGSGPSGRLTYANGMLYGTTSGSGSSHAPLSSTVFGLSLRGAERVLYSFAAPQFSDGTEGGLLVPNDLLVVNGVGFGTTVVKDLGGGGTIYSFGPAGKHTLHTFGNGQDGADPNGLLFANGMYYGTTRSGGAYNAGTAFTFNGSQERVLYTFVGGADGNTPAAGLTLVDGDFYGTTEYGGAYGAGTVFKLTASGSETVLHSFGDSTDGLYPRAGLVYADGALYGTTYGGGTGFVGTVFELRLKNSMPPAAAR